MPEALTNVFTATTPNQGAEQHLVVFAALYGKLFKQGAR